MLKAKDIMTRDVITVKPSMPVEELARLLYERKISGAPVVDEDGDLRGVVTESDLIDQAKNVHIPTVLTILDSFLVLESPKKLDQEMRKMAGRTVNDIYTPGSVTVGENASLADVASVMAEKKVHTLPVVENGLLVGVIGKTDLIRAIGSRAF